MGLLRRIADVFDPAPPPEQRNLGAYDLDPRLFEFDRPSRLPSVGADAVLSNLSVAARCVALRSEMLASVPLYVYRRLPDGGRERADDHPLSPILQEEANPRQTAYEARELLVRSLDLAGNALGRVERDRTGDVTALWASPPRDVTVERLASGRLRYVFAMPRRQQITLLEGAGEVLHIRAASSDGELGRSPLMVARGSLQPAMAQMQTAQSLMLNSLRPSATASHPGKLSEKARDNIQKSIESAASGPYGAGRMLVLEEGLKIEPWSFSPKDAEFLQQRQVSNEDVARIFGVPPAVLGIGERPTYGSAVEESRQLVASCLAPLAARVEAAMMRDLLSDVDWRAGFFIMHDLDGLLRGDLKTRFEAYRIGREAGIWSPNDCRRREGEAPIPNGDEYMRPLNFAPLGTPAVLPREGRVDG